MSSAHSRKILALVITLALAAVTTFSTYAQAITITERVIEPIETLVFACNGETVLVSGELLIIPHATFDDRGGIHGKITLVARHVRGVGSVTGIQYKAVESSQRHFNETTDGAPINFTDSRVMNLISQGRSDNLHIKSTFHITVNANGEVTARVINFSAQCVG